MNPLLRNILAAVAGFIVGSIVNIGIVNISGSVIAPPDGADMTTAEGIKAAMSRMEPKHFLMPFLAHALGTFVGALVAALIAVHRKMTVALICGVLFLLGGIAATFMIPAPVWFVALDLIFAYLPMAYLAGKVAESRARAVVH